MRSKQAFLFNLDTQVGQIAKLLFKQLQSSLPSNTKGTPQEHLKIFTLRIGKEVWMSKDKMIKKEKQPTIEVYESPIKEGEATSFVEKSVPPPVKEYVP